MPGAQLRRILGGAVHFLPNFVEAVLRHAAIRDGKVDQKEGVVYVTSGGGGGKLEDFAPTPAFFKENFRSDYHFCYVTVHNGTFNLKAFDVEGRLFDQFTLQK